MRVGVMKPVETGCAEVGGELQALDANALALAAGSQLPADLICPYRYRSPLAPLAAADADQLLWNTEIRANGAQLSAADIS